MDGLLGAIISSLFTFWVAIYAVRRTQHVDRASRHENQSLGAAERLTVVLLDTGRRLDQLSEHVAASRAARRAAYRGLAVDLRMATNLHAPVLTPKALAGLPSLIRPVLDAFVKAVEQREDAVMRDERLDENTEDNVYARDRSTAQLRDALATYLSEVTDALTVYRQGGNRELPAVPSFAASAVNAA
jgi:hypothetical protein